MKEYESLAARIRSYHACVLPEENYSNPSGLNVWSFKDEHRPLLEKATGLLADERVRLSALVSEIRQG